MASPTPMDTDDQSKALNPFQLYRLPGRKSEGKEGHTHTLLKISRYLQGKPGTRKAFNLLMADCSGSMSLVFPSVVEGWNKSVAPKLSGHNELYVFGCTIHHLRSTPELYKEDNKSGGTNLTGALQVVTDEVTRCAETFIQVFIITDGMNTDRKSPESVIENMSVPAGKTVNVFLLGIGDSFPVNYSIDIRSRLHNGTANVPPLFWAKECEDIVDQMAAIGDHLDRNVRVIFNRDAFKVPGLEASGDFYSGDWVFLPPPPEELGDLSATIDDRKLAIATGATQQITVEDLLDGVFLQWNNGMIQQHRTKKPVPDATFDLMEDVFEAAISHVETGSSIANARDIKNRLIGKRIRELRSRYTVLMSKSRSVIKAESRYLNELELADLILSSTVSGSKYETKALRLRGQTTSEFEKQVQEFVEVVEKALPDLLALDDPKPEECCHVTLTSTLLDLRDPDFKLLFEDLNKFEVLKTFTMTGIPALAPMRCATTINIWSLTITNILTSPFTILSQSTLEYKAGSGGTGEDGAVRLQDNNKDSEFNIVIPVIPAAAAAAMRPLVNTGFYATMASFCILKNPHVVDFWAHVAALAVAWLRSVTDHPIAARPQYVTDRLEAIAATAELYMKRKSIEKYLSALCHQPSLALMTESKEMYQDQIIKCESLTKPLFYLGLRKDYLSAGQLGSLLGLLLQEFLSRCLYQYKKDKTDATPYTDFFATHLCDAKARARLKMSAAKPLIEEFGTHHPHLLKEFYAPENVTRAIQDFIQERKEELNKLLTESIVVAVNMNKVQHLHSPAICGDVHFKSFAAWAREMGLAEDMISETLDVEQITIMVHRALKCRETRDRYAPQEQLDYNQCLAAITDKIKEECCTKLMKELIAMIRELVVKEWRQEYSLAHSGLVRPLSVASVVQQAQAAGVGVTLDTFTQVYKYNPQCQLLRNACQMPQCPHYLQPTRRFNQHLAAERTPGTFPHSLHLVSRQLCGGEVDTVVSQVVSGQHSGTNGRRKHPISDPEKINHMSREIEDLMARYKEDLAV